MENNFLSLIKTRRSVRAYKPQPVPSEALDAVLEAGTYAPTGGGRQSPTIIAITDPKYRQEIARLNAEVGWEPYGYIGNVRFSTVKAVRLSCGSGSCRKPCVASERLHWVIQLRKPVSPQHANKTILFGFNNLLSGAIFLRRTLCGELMNAASIWIGVGVNVLIAGYLGQKKQDEANTTVTHGLLLAFGIGALLNLLSLLIMKPYFRAFTNNEEIYQLSIAYMSVCSFMQIPNMVHIAIQKMIQATGNMVAPMWFQIAGVVVNFALNPILIFGVGIFPTMGIRGSAVATVAGYLLSMILAFVLLLGKKQKVRIKIKGFRLQKRLIGRIFALGLPSFIMNALSSFMVTFVNLFLVAYSDTAIAFFGAYFKVQQLIVMTVNGLIQGCLPVMRFNYGAGNSERLHAAFRYGTALVTGMMILGTLAILLFPAQILGLFTASEAMRSFGISAMRIMAASYLFCGLSTMISTYFQATEQLMPSMLIQLLRQLLLLIPFMWCLEKLLKITGIWLSFPVAEATTFVLAFLLFQAGKRKEALCGDAKTQ